MLANAESKPGVSWRLWGLVIVGAIALVASPLVYLSHATGADTRPEVEFFPPLSDNEQRVAMALSKPTSFQFVEAPLRNVLDFLEDAVGLESAIHIDRLGTEEVGVATDTPITCTVKDLPLASALRLVLEPLGLVATIDNEVILITSQDKADSILITRTYPVGDLVVNKDFHTLTGAIRSTVRPNSWDEVGGNGSVVEVPQAKSLVISQTRRDHDEVLQLLRALRAAKDGPPADLK